jgi:hypothetical protein
MTAPITLATGQALGARLTEWIPALERNEIPKSAGQEIVKGLARASEKQRRWDALQAILAILDPDGVMGAWHGAQAIAERLRELDGVALRRIRSGAREPSELEALLMVLIEIPGPKCRDKLWRLLAGMD